MKNYNKLKVIAMKGIVFSTEEFSVFDGPGIRSSVFLKGCPLRCSWCHNPESQKKEIEYLRNPNGCANCGSCLTDGKLTEKSVSACKKNLVRVCGEEVAPKDVCSSLLKNKDILEASGGGVTFSGGEPTLQSEFLLSCLKLLDKKLHRAVQTCGFCEKDKFRQIIENCELVLFDLKIIDEELHKKYTGASNKIILENFRELVKSGKNFIIRTPLIPTVTDTAKNLTDIANLLKENNVNYIELLPYNTMAGGKYKMCMRKFEPMFDESIKCEPRVEIFEILGITAKVL